MSRKRWVVPACDRQTAREIADECDIDSLVALILVARGYADPFEVEEFLSDDQQLCDPFELIDMDKAVDRIHKALESGEKICVYGDYDADGVTSTAMLYTYLKSKGADVSYIVPEREENYGLNNNAIDKMAADGVTLMITVDNGISAIEEIKYANYKGINVVVTDHHLPQSELPDAVAVVDPHRLDCPSSFKDYAGAGVCFKLLCALEGVSGEELYGGYVDLAAVGTVADVMPLVGENRIIVKRGVERLESNRVGLSAIIDAAGLRKRAINSVSVSFGIAPRLNAAGRVGSCKRAVNLLIETDKKAAELLAAEINQANATRQSLEKDISNQAVKLIEQQRLNFDRVIVVCGEGWHHGVIGIVASRICEKYGRPAIVLTDSGDTVSGSARSTGDFSLYSAIDACSEVLERFGGHAQAAGVSMPKENVDIFRKMINEYAAKEYFDMPFAELKIDCKLKPSAFTVDMIRSMEALEPFGSGNAIPVFGLFNMRIDKITPVGSAGNHLRLELSRDSVSICVMKFNCALKDFGYRVGEVIDLAVSADINEFSGREQVSLTAKGVRASNVDEDALLMDIRLYERVKRGESLSGYEHRCKLDRDIVANVYKSVRNGFSGDIEALHSRLGSDCFAKLKLSLDVLKELGIIEYNEADGVILVSAKNVDRKFELEESVLYRSLSSL